MTRASNGIYTLPNTVNPVVPGTDILAEWANATLDDVAQALTESLDRNGKGSMSAPFKAVAGTVALPGVTFSAEPSSGLYRLSGGGVGMSVSGVQVMRWDAAGAVAATIFTAVGAATFAGTLTVTGAFTASSTGVFTGAVTAAAATVPTHLAQLSQVSSAFAAAINIPVGTAGLVAGGLYSTASNFTVPAGLNVDAVYEIYNSGAGILTISFAGGVTARLSGSTLTGTREIGAYGLMVIKPITTNNYLIFGAGVA